MRFLLYSTNQANTSFYVDLVENYGGEVVPACDLESLLASPPKNLYFNGFLVDVFARARAKIGEKAILRDLEEGFPTLVLRRSAHQGVVFMAFNAAIKNRKSLVSYLEHCHGLGPRTLRFERRKEMYVPLMVSLDGRDFGDQNRTFTMNISAGGCFIFTTRRFEIGQVIYVKMHGVSDCAPVPVEVRWQRLWEECRGAPGIGVRFLEAEEAQRHQIRHLFAVAGTG